MFFGNKNALCLTSGTESVMNKLYYVIGQLTVVSIITVNRRPKYLYPAIVRSLFRVAQPSETEYVDDENTNNILSAISVGIYNSLIDVNTNIYGKASHESINMCNLSIAFSSDIVQLNNLKKRFFQFTQDFVIRNTTKQCNHY